MKNPMHAFSVDLFTNILGNLSWLLQKAEANATAATAARKNRRRKIPMGPDLVTMSLTVC